MRTKYLSIIAISAIMSACSNGNSIKTENTDVIAAAHRDASAVVDASNDIFQQEKAVLAIRVRENALRDAGYDEEADEYIDEVSKILVDSLHILDPCK